MPIAEVNAVGQVKLARRAAVRTVQRMDAGGLAPQEVDLARMLFGETGPEEKLAKLGLIHDEGLCDVLVASVAHRVRELYDSLAPVAPLAERFKERFKAMRLDPDRPDLFKQPVAEGREDVALRNAEASELAAAKLLSAHLCQRALYEGLTLALEGLVRDQAVGVLPAGKSHGPILMGPKKVAQADVAIERMRKEHMTAVPARGYVPLAIAAGVVVDPDLDAKMYAAMGMELPQAAE